MKRRLRLTLMLCFTFSISIAQKLEKVFISDTIVRNVLSEFIPTSEAACTLYEDMGVIKMIVYPDSGVEERKIYLIASIDDSFKSNPPRKFAHFAGKVILIYYADEQGRTISNSLPPEEVTFLLEEVGDRVFPEKTIRGRWIEEYGKDGALLSRNRIQLVKGGTSPYGIFIVIDNKTGKVQKLKTL